MKDYIHPKMIRCQICEELFDASQRNRGKGVQKYCGPKCRQRADSKRAYARRKKPAPILDRICSVCGLPFTTDISHPRALTCSVKCNEARMNAKRRLRTRVKLVHIIKECGICGVKFQPHRRAINVQKYCSPECSHTAELSLQRERSRSALRLNPNGQRFNRKEWQEAKLRVLERDKSCRVCGSSLHLHVHHISHATEVERGDHSDENLTALCNSCHSRVHHFQLSKQEGQWVIYGEVFKMLNIAKVQVGNHG